MPRELCVGNGNLQVNIDNDLNIRDMYFPFVGMENHVSGHFCRFGVWVDGRFLWVDDSWNKRFNYKEDSLVMHACMMSLYFSDFHSSQFVVHSREQDGAMSSGEFGVYVYWVVGSI